MGRAAGPLILIVLLLGLAACGAAPHRKAGAPMKRTKTAASTQPSAQSASPPQGTGSQSPSGPPSLWPSQPTDFPGQVQEPVPWPTQRAPVNGCDPWNVDPAFPAPICLSSAAPKFFCCSPAYDNWSGVVEGATIDLKGSMQIDPSTKRPIATGVLLIDPYGKRTLIPVAADGSFSESVTFGSIGTWHLGVLYDGRPANMVRFVVAWSYVWPSGTPTTASTFPASTRSRIWPANDTFLAVPVGTTTSVGVTVVNAQGVPQPHVAVSPKGSMTDAAGHATLEIDPGATFAPPLAVAPNIYAQGFADIVPDSGTLTGFPPLPSPLEPVGSITRSGVTYYDVAGFLAHMDTWFSAPPAPAVTFDASTRFLAVSNEASGALAGLDTRAGAVEVGSYGIGGDTYTKVGTASPVTSAGRVRAVLVYGQIGENWRSGQDSRGLRAHPPEVGGHRKACPGAYSWEASPLQRLPTQANGRSHHT